MLQLEFFLQPCNSKHKNGLTFCSIIEHCVPSLFCKKFLQIGLAEEEEDRKYAGRPEQTWKKHVKNEIKKNRRVKMNACDRMKWRGVVKTKDNHHTKSGQLCRWG